MVMMMMMMMMIRCLHGLHSFVCSLAPGKITKHHALNDVVARAFSSAGMRYPEF